jgi:hypothetical protein
MTRKCLLSGIYVLFTFIYVKKKNVNYRHWNVNEQKQIAETYVVEK